MNATEDSCYRIQEIWPEPVDLIWLQAVFGLLYGLVMALGLIGNLLTLYCLFALKVSVGIDCSFILSLSLSNVLMGLTALPFTGIQIFSRIWLFGLRLCQAVPLFQAMGIFVSSFTLMAIAYDRYQQISKMRMGAGDKRQRALIVVGMWVVAFACSMPYALYMRFSTYPHIDGNTTLGVYCGKFCEEGWPGSDWPRVYAAAVLSIQFLMPLVVLLYCYGRLRNQVVASVRRRLTQRLTEDARSRVMARQSKTSKMTSLLFLGFIGPWLPFNLFAVFREYNTSLKLISEDYLSISFGVVHLIAMTSTMWNPIIYCWMNSELKKSLRRCCCGPPRPRSPDEKSRLKGLTTSPPTDPLTTPLPESQQLL